MIAISVVRQRKRPCSASAVASAISSTKVKALRFCEKPLIGYSTMAESDDRPVLISPVIPMSKAAMAAPAAANDSSRTSNPSSPARRTISAPVAP
jgi:hypothetical protein